MNYLVISFLAVTITIHIDVNCKSILNAVRFDDQCLPAICHLEWALDHLQCHLDSSNVF